jgi:hypothetical protein
VKTRGVLRHHKERVIANRLRFVRDTRWWQPLQWEGQPNRWDKTPPWKLCSCQLCKRDRYSRKVKHKQSLLLEQDVVVKNTSEWRKLESGLSWHKFV